MKLVVVASLAWSLVNFRGALLRRMVAEGHEVTACAPDDDPQVTAQLQAMGVRYRQVPMDRTGLNPFRDLSTLRGIARILRTEAPDAVLAYTQKPIIYTGLATRLVGSRIRFFAMVSGLGHVYSDGGGTRRWVLRRLLSRLYRIAIARAERVFVFNRDDAHDMRAEGILGRQTVVQVPGSGVDISHFRAESVPEGPPVFLLVARLMRSKGLMEFVTAAGLVRERFPDARFCILGPLDPNPEAITRDELDRWVAEGNVEYLGATRDVAPYLAQASVFVLPTWYREGLPRTILEALATGRAVITTETPGCRETVEPGWNGFLVPPRDAGALADAMMQLVDAPERIATMGANSRALAEERFDVNKVNDLLVTEMGLIRDSPLPPRVDERCRGLGDLPLLELPLAAVAGILLLPLMALVALAVLLSLGRPILFSQQRAGLDGRPFTLVKFRTMRPSPDATGRVLPDEERLTWTGRVLRRTRLDELPELWNILRREMDLIGPRPLLPETIAAMGAGGRARSAVRPGLSGWAQVNGNVLLDNADKLSLDLWYVSHRSVRLDLGIMLRTLLVLVRGERINSEEVARAYAGTADRRG